MFDYLNNASIFLRNNEDFEDASITGFNEETKKFIAKDEYTDNQVEIDLFKENIPVNITYIEGWQSEIYHALQNNGKVDLEILSTESGDCWNLSIYRQESKLHTNEFESKFTIINYVITICEEVKGEILTIHKETEEDEKEYDKYLRWIEEQVNFVSEFNNIEMFETLNSIIIGSCFANEEEYKIMYEMFNDGVQFKMNS